MYTPRTLCFMTPARPTPKIDSALRAFNSESWLPLHKPTNDKCVLFHYTDIKGLTGILETRTIWAGHASAFNDPLEIKHGRALINELLNREADTEDASLAYFFKQISTYTEAFGGDFYEPFIISFCESENLLSQWREYAQRGGGYCLGFEFTDDTLIYGKSAGAMSAKPVFLRKVVYDEEIQRDMAERAVTLMKDAAIEELRNAEERGEDPFVLSASMALYATNIFFDLMLSFKHPAFKSEAEWRLLKVSKDDHEAEDIEFILHENELVPYRALHIYEDTSTSKIFPLRSIGFGPTLEAEKAKAAVRLLLNKRYHDKHVIGLPKPYEVPLSWAGYSVRKT